MALLAYSQIPEQIITVFLEQRPLNYLEFLTQRLQRAG